MFCKHCGGEIPEGGAFCPKCGKSTDRGNAPLEEKGGRRKKGRILGAFVGILLLLMGLAALFRMFPGESGKRMETESETKEEKPIEKLLETAQTESESESETESETEQAAEPPDEEETEAPEEEWIPLETDPHIHGWGGAYQSREDGKRLVIAASGYEVCYCFYEEDGSIRGNETDCVMMLGDDACYVEGTYYAFGVNDDGTVNATSGIGGAWGRFDRISGTQTPDARIEGIYGDGDVMITVFNQIADNGSPQLPGGADIADIRISYNQGFTLEGWLTVQQDGSLGIIECNSKEVRGMAVFQDGKVNIMGSAFDGTYERNE